MQPLVIITRLVITFALSFFFGLERQKAHKPVGFGTFIFVSLGSTALGLIAISGVFQNPIALLSAIVTGIGFLGAGALVRGTDKVFGFTTAASIWLLAIFGLCIGIGEYIIGFTIYILIWMVVFSDRYLEIKGMGSYQRKIVVGTNKIIEEKEIKQYVLKYTKRYKKLNAEINKQDKELKITFLVEGTKENLNKLVSDLYSKEWVKSCKLE